MNNEILRLKNGSRIAVIGGGPAGSFFALYMLRYASLFGIRPDITIYQARDFSRLGPEGCKGCAGVLSISFIKNLHDFGLRIPEHIIQSNINHYAVHSPYNSINISNPEKDIQIVSVYRGSGPRILMSDPILSFDAWLLDQAGLQGAMIEHKTVKAIQLGRDTSILVDGESREYDLIVLANGINAQIIPINGLSYTRPEARWMFQDELYAGKEQVESSLGGAAHTFLIPNSPLIFGTLVPKGPYITVSVYSEKKSLISVTEFLANETVQGILPGNYERTCGCRPSMIVGTALNYFFDRFVAIGDAAVSRLYKDGIGSSLLTARQAAYTAIHHGVSAGDFKLNYEPFCHKLKRDNKWGRLLFSINNRVKNSRTFLLTQHRLIGNEMNKTGGSQPFTKAAWGMFTGSYSYRQIVNMMSKPVALGNLVMTVFIERWWSFWRRSEPTLRKLHVGTTRVLILGSGFGGTYVLRKLVPALNFNENVQTTMVSDENFFLFSPLLHEVAMGRIESRHVAYPIRRLHWRDRFKFIQANVKKIDLLNSRVQTDSGTLAYDYLVLALGGVVDMSKFRNTEHNIPLFTLKTLYDSRLLKNHIIMTFELASSESEIKHQKPLLTFVISGAGYLGLQVVTELRDFIFHSLKKYYQTIDIDSIRIILVEKESRLVPELHPKLSAYAMKQLWEMGIEVRFNSCLTRFGEDFVEINNDEIIPTNTVIWVSGQLSNPRISELNVKTDNLGRILVNEYLEVPGYSRVYALGDCAHFKDPDTFEPVPRRAHVAVRQAKTVAKNIMAEIRGQNKKPFRYSRPPELVSLGASKAMFRFRGLRLYGFLARIIWFGGYSLLVTGSYNRVRVIIDWTSALIFGRDTSCIKEKIGR